MSAPHANYILLLDILLLIGVMGYITLPVKDVPFHGDESTTIWMSGDYQTAVLAGEFDELAYADPPRHTTEQHMRIITSNLSKIAMGMSWQSSGMKQSDLNEQWVWSLDLSQNQVNGSLPSENLLYVTRLSSAWLLALSTIFILATSRLIARHLFTHKWAIIVTSWSTLGIYTFFYPAILLNGRRAMFEGGLLFGLALVSWVSVRLISKKERNWSAYILLGICTGFALSTKHSAAFTVILLYSSLLLTDIITYFHSTQSTEFAIKQLTKLSIATALALLIFLGLNPLWWSHPFGMPAIVIEQRQLILEEQVTYFPEDKYTSFPDRVIGLGEEILDPSTQYYEAIYWIDYSGVAEEIDGYHNSIWTGLRDCFWITVLRGGMLLSGLMFITYSGIKGNWLRRRLTIHLGIWLGGIVLITLITVPLHWQRYYLPILIPLSIMLGIGVGASLNIILQRFNHS